MVEGAALEMLCPERDLGFESLTLRQVKKASNQAGLRAFFFCLKTLKNRSKKALFSLFFPRFRKELILSFLRLVFIRFRPFTAEIVRTGKKYSAFHRLRRRQFRTVIKVSINICCCAEIAVP